MHASVKIIDYFFRANPKKVQNVHIMLHIEKNIILYYLIILNLDTILKHMSAQALQSKYGQNKHIVHAHALIF